MATAIRFAARETTLVLVLGPLALCGLVAFAVPYGLTSIIARQPESFEARATWNALSGIIIYGLWMMGIAATVGSLSHALIGVAVLCALPALAVASLFAFEREAAIIRAVRAFLAAARRHR